MASSSTRTPAVEVTLNGFTVAGVIDAEVSSNSHLAANRFKIRMALDVNGAAAWSGAELRIGVAFGLDGALVPMLLGEVDFVEIDPIRGDVSIEGRDLTALFVEARTQETFENQTASEIATLLAGRRGLAANVSSTSQPVGRNFQSQYARTTLDQHARVTTEWDLLTRLAQQEGFGVWVDQQTLFFMPETSQGSATITPADCSALRLERTVWLESDLSIAVKSWDCRGETSITQTAALGAAGGAPSYVVVRPNATADAALDMAQRILGEMSAHARCIDIEMPGELTLQPRQSLTLAQTGTDFDGSYVISEVERRISFRDGFTQHLRARVPAWIASSI